MWTLSVYLPPHSSDSFLSSPPQWSGNFPVQKREFLSHLNCYYHDNSQHHQLCLSGLSTRMTLKKEQFSGTFWFALTAHMIGSHRFPKLLCLFTRSVTSRAAAATPPCLLIVSLTPGHLSWFWFAPVGLASVNLLHPQNLPEDVSTSKGNKQAPPGPQGHDQETCTSGSRRRRRQL